MSGARWYRAACTAHFHGRSAGTVVRSDGAGLGAAERFVIAATEARLGEVEELAAPPPFRSAGVMVWIRATDGGGAWLEARAETLWIADWEVRESVRDEGRIVGRLRGTAFLEVKDDAAPREEAASAPLADAEVSRADTALLPSSPPEHTAPYVPDTTSQGVWSGDHGTLGAPRVAPDPWVAMEGLDLGLGAGRARASRPSGCAWLGGGAGLGALLLAGCCLAGPLFRVLGGLGVGGGSLLGGLFGVLVALVLTGVLWRLWGRRNDAQRSGCGPRVLAVVALLWLLGGCLAAAAVVTSLLGRGVPRVVSPFVGGFDLGCWQTGLAYRSRAGERIRVTCPGACTLHRVWGTDVYTDDSSICAAAQHAGLLRGASTTVTLRVRDGRDGYVGSSRNGIASSAWGRWGGSFSFCDGPTPETQCEDPVTPPPAPAPDVRPATATARVSLSVSVAPRSAGGAAWDVANGLPDLAICVTTDARRCVPEERPDRARRRGLCQDTLRCQVHAPIAADARSLHIEVIDRDVARNDLVGAGDCAFGGSCRVGRAMVTIGPAPEPVPP
jgi:hypothetical protein